MAKPDTLRGKRVILEPFSKRFLTDNYICWLNDPEVVRFSEQRHHRHTRQSCRQFLKSFDNNPHCFWAILKKGSNQTHIGNISAYIDSFNGLAEITILIGDKKEWGKGYATEAWSAVCDYLLISKKIRKITGGALSINRAMVRVMEKVNMMEDGRRMRHLLWEGKEVDVLYMAKFNG